ncbi:MAG: hydrogenase maturation protease [Gammaproteobacteria bacterium]|nr:hydrogenase maturation protease [Gammaproteobacteria bacterium]MCP5416994.1 hydrogenase maturation protease [Chromatiaceae bacterium]
MVSPVLVLGCGNPARGDDGLGPALIQGIEIAALEGIETRVDYQLCVEDALDIGSFTEVIIVDASSSVLPPYQHYSLPQRLEPVTFDTHSLSPEALIHLARTLFGATNQASVLAIRGYHFEPFTESLSEPARQNLKAALIYLVHRLGGGRRY